MSGITCEHLANSGETDGPACKRRNDYVKLDICTYLVIQTTRMYIQTYTKSNYYSTA